jgi:hypothetical protein
MTQSGHRTRADRPEEMAGRDQAGRGLIVRHAAWRNTRRRLLDKTQSAAALFAVTKSTWANIRISVNRWCSPDVSPLKGFLIFIVDPLSFLLRQCKRAICRIFRG